MKEEIALKWIEELRSGRHEQAKEALRLPDASMCCLGVLQCVVLKQDATPDDAWLSQDAQKAAGMKSNVGSLPDRVRGSRTLTRLNDGMGDVKEGLSFLEIADIIEAHWPEL